MINASAVILSGGKSSRMKVNKAFVKINRQHMIELAIRKLQPLFNEVIIVTNKPEEYSGLGVKMTTDLVPGQGPLGGIQAGLMAAGNLHSFVMACDMPFVEPALSLLSKKDYVLIAGDFGFIQDFNNGGRYWLEWFEKKNFTTLFVDGNNENFGLLNSYPIEWWCGGKVHRISDSIIHLMRGQVFEFDGTKIFTFGGAKSKGIEHKIEKGLWWEEEMPSEEEYFEGIKALERYKWEVDYIVTHACPGAALQYISNQCGIKGKANELHAYFDELNQKVKYKHWYFGHYHFDLRLSDRMTLLFNKVERII